MAAHAIFADEGPDGIVELLLQLRRIREGGCADAGQQDDKQPFHEQLFCSFRRHAVWRGLSPNSR
jgi:hypothetical protein